MCESLTWVDEIIHHSRLPVNYDSDKQLKKKNDSLGLFKMAVFIISKLFKLKILYLGSGNQILNPLAWIMK